MSINQKSEPLSRGICLIKSIKGRYVSYTAKSEPVYGRKYEFYDLEKHATCMMIFHSKLNTHTGANTKVS